MTKQLGMAKNVVFVILQINTPFFARQDKPIMKIIWGKKNKENSKRISGNQR